MKVYLSSRYGRKDEMEKYAEQLRNMELIVCSRWHSGAFEIPGKAEEDYSEEEQGKFAEADLEDIQDCDIFVAFTEEPDAEKGRGGRHFETGYAYALGKQVVVVGPAENCFHCLSITRYKTWDRPNSLLLMLLRYTALSEAHLRRQRDDATG